MKLPEKFKFRFGESICWHDEDVEYIHSATVTGDVVTVDWDKRYEQKLTFVNPWTEASVDQIVEAFEKGSYVMIEEQVGIYGEDDNGNTVYLTEDMIKPFMRVVTFDGMTFIVALTCNDVKVLAKHNCWDYLKLPEVGENNVFQVKEVYESTGYTSNILNSEVKGKLIWRYVDPALKARKEYLDTYIVALKKQMEDAEKEREALN